MSSGGEHNTVKNEDKAAGFSLSFGAWPFPVSLFFNISLRLYYSVWFCSACHAGPHSFHTVFKKKTLKAEQILQLIRMIAVRESWSYLHYLNINKCVGNRNLTLKNVLHKMCCLKFVSFKRHLKKSGISGGHHPVTKLNNSALHTATYQNT